MQAELAGTALLMGLAGGPHCVAMCGAACSGVIRIVRVPERSATVALHAGRVAGYAAAGAAAAVAGAKRLGAASEKDCGASGRCGSCFHAFVLVWGLVAGRAGASAPIGALRRTRALAFRLRALTRSTAGVLATGALWVLMPCGLLYSALMLYARTCKRTRAGGGRDDHVRIGQRRLDGPGTVVVAAAPLRCERGAQGMGWPDRWRIARDSGAPGTVDRSQPSDRDLVSLKRLTHACRRACKFGLRP